MNNIQRMKITVCVELLEQLMSKIVERTKVNRLPVGVQHIVTAYVECVGLERDNYADDEKKQFMVSCRHKTVELHDMMKSYQLPNVFVSLITYMYEAVEDRRLPIPKDGSTMMVISKLYEALKDETYSTLRVTRETMICHDIIRQYVDGLKQ